MKTSFQPQKTLAAILVLGKKAQEKLHASNRSEAVYMEQFIRRMILEAKSVKRIRIPLHSYKKERSELIKKMDMLFHRMEGFAELQLGTKAWQAQRISRFHKTRGVYYGECFELWIRLFHIGFRDDFYKQVDITEKEFSGMMKRYFLLENTINESDSSALHASWSKLTAYKGVLENLVKIL